MYTMMILLTILILSGRIKIGAPVRGAGLHTPGMQHIELRRAHLENAASSGPAVDARRRHHMNMALMRLINMYGTNRRTQDEIQKNAAQSRRALRDAEYAHALTKKYQAEINRHAQDENLRQINQYIDFMHIQAHRGVISRQLHAAAYQLGKINSR